MRKNQSKYASRNYPNLYRYPNSAFWVFRKFSAQKHREFRCSTKESKNEARAYKFGLDAYNKWLGFLATPGRPVTISDIGNLILEEKRNTAELYEKESGRRDQTYRSAKNQIKNHIVQNYGHLRPEQFTLSKWEERILDQRKRNPKHKMFNERKHLIMIQQRAVRDGYLANVPKYRNPDPKPEAGTYLKDDTIHILLRCASRMTKLLLFIMWKQGARPGEILQYEWEMIHFDEGEHGSIHIPGRITKTRRSREIPLNSSVSRILRWLKDRSKSSFLFPSPAYLNSPMTEYKTGWNTAKRKANKLIENRKLKVQKVKGTTYALRDTFVTNCAKRGVNILFVAKFIDSSVKMLERHYLVTEREAMQGVAG
jgi:integrase